MIKLSSKSRLLEEVVWFYQETKRNGTRFPDSIIRGKHLRVSPTSGTWLPPPASMGTSLAWGVKLPQEHLTGSRVGELLGGHDPQLCLEQPGCRCPCPRLELAATCLYSPPPIEL